MYGTRMYLNFVNPDFWATEDLISNCSDKMRCRNNAIVQHFRWRCVQLTLSQYPSSVAAAESTVARRPTIWKTVKDTYEGRRVITDTTNMIDTLCTCRSDEWRVSRRPSANRYDMKCRRITEVTLGEYEAMRVIIRSRLNYQEKMQSQVWYPRLCYRYHKTCCEKLFYHLSTGLWWVDDSGVVVLLDLGVLEMEKLDLSCSTKNLHLRSHTRRWLKAGVELNAFLSFSITNLVDHGGRELRRQ